MTYWYLKESTTADLADVNDNFQHVGAGSRLPMAGSMLVETTGVYDLGSDSYRWKTAYLNNIEISNVIDTQGQMWIIESLIEITATASSVEFTSLNGDVNPEYQLFMYAYNESGSTATISMIFNNDSATNYGYAYLKASSITVSGDESSSSSIEIGKCDTKLSFSNVCIQAESGRVRSSIVNNGNSLGGASMTSLYHRSATWNNTSDTLTSIKIITTENFDAGSFFLIWKRA